MPVTNHTPCLVCDITNCRTQCQCPKHVVPPVSCVISQEAEPNARNKSYFLSRARYHKMQNPMSVKNLVCDITRCRTCPEHIVPLVSYVISHDSEPDAPNKSFPLFRVLYHKMQNPMPVTNRTTCLVCVIWHGAEPNARNKSYARCFVGEITRCRAQRP